MRTLVIQSFRTEGVPPWISRCLDSVKSWAALRNFDYYLSDDSSFELCGPEYLAKVGRNMRAITNLSRLELAKDAHLRGYDRTIWLDADVLVFHPALFTIDLEERYAFARETWVAPQGDRWAFQSHVNNCAFVCMRDEPDLDALIRLVRHIGVHRQIDKSFQTGTYLLTGLQRSLAFEMLDNVGMFSNHVVLALVHNRERALATQAIGHQTPVFAANLCASEREALRVSESEAEVAIDRLLETRGAIVNRWLLQSQDNLLRGQANPGMAALFPHEVNVRLQFRQKHEYEPNLAQPKTFNERIAARKLTLTGELHRRTADKYAVREFVREHAGEQYLIPLLQVCEKAEDLDFDSLPNAFILKPTHGSGWKEIVRDKAAADRDALRSRMRSWLRSNFFSNYFEVHYRDIPPGIVAEELLQTESGQSPNNYMFFVFGGTVQVISLSLHHGTPEMTITRFDRAWRPLAVTGRKPADYSSPPPSRLGEMIEVAERLGSNFDFARIDLYCLGNKVYFGEITHTPNGGLTKFTPVDFDRALGQIWESGGSIPDKYYYDTGLPDASLVTSRSQIRDPALTLGSALDAR